MMSIMLVLAMGAAVVVVVTRKTVKPTREVQTVVSQPSGQL